MQMATLSIRLFLLFLIAVFNQADGKYVDLTYNVNAEAMRWPTHHPYSSSIAIRGPVMDLPFLAINNFDTSEHMATHIDAPYHFIENGLKLHEMEFDNLHGPGVVIDIQEKAKKNADATLDIEDLKAWEVEFKRPIPPGAIIIMNSGYGKYWGNSTAFIGGDSVTTMHFPGFSGPAVEWLLEHRDIKGIAVDTVSCDIGSEMYAPAHHVILGANKWCVEMVANIDKIHKMGADIYTMPIKLEDGTGAPIRLYAMWGYRDPWAENSVKSTMAPNLYLIAEMCLSFLCVFFLKDMFIYD